LYLAICKEGCQNGTCVNAPGTCKCKGHFGGEICDRCEDGWQGDFCDTGYLNLLLDSLSFLILKNPSAICSSNCENGNCTIPGTCLCYPGWYGVNCSVCKSIFSVLVIMPGMKLQIFIATIPLVSDHLPLFDMSGPDPYGTVPRLANAFHV
jgi:hypothetical protein